MTNEEFDRVVEERVTKLRSLVKAKGAEYARGDTDRLRNFKRGGELLRCIPERCLLGYLTKHFVSVIDLVQDLDAGKDVQQAMWDAKIGDAITYLVLLEGLVRERAQAFGVVVELNQAYDLLATGGMSCRVCGGVGLTTAEVVHAIDCERRKS